MKRGEERPPGSNNRSEAPSTPSLAALRDVPVARHDACAGHDVRGVDVAIIPDRHRAVVVAPENVALSVAVVIASIGDMPAIRYDVRVGNNMRRSDLAVIPD